MVDILKKTKKGSEIAARFRDSELATTSICFYEILNGTDEESVQDFFSSLSIFDFDKKSAREASKILKDLSRKGSLIGEMDILIGAICIANDAKLITLDKDFKKVKGLDCEIID
ncbi:MAG: type II toxin-antitoxin system VapC family toxin [Candidatus Aenigmarchaeota archaeon]|nr:type II toxin-antitoxin system VapC family toxin [Candidatus Aenigmarchaeota archaeon]